MSKKICVIGAGKQGVSIGNKFLEIGYDVTAIDISEPNLKHFNGEKKVFDITDKKLIDFLKNFQLIVNSLPAKIGKLGILSAISSKVNMVDISFIEENIYDFENEIKSANITLIPDCGVAPGLSNLCVGDALRKLGKIKNINIYVGGIPIEPIPPLNLCVTFNSSDLLSEYKRKVTIIENNKRKIVEPLTGIEEIKFLENNYECFYTDGLRSLIKNIECENMIEKTIRYIGHADWIKRKNESELLKILDEYSKLNIKDKILFRVIASNENKKITYEMIDYYDEKNKTTAMTRTTGYTAVVIGKLLLENKIHSKGLIAPEKLGEDENVFKCVLDELEKFDIKINISES